MHTPPHESHLECVSFADGPVHKTHHLAKSINYIGKKALLLFNALYRFAEYYL